MTSVGGTMNGDVKDVVRRYVQEVWNEGRLDRLEELVSPGYVEHAATFPLVARGIEGLVRVISFFRGAFPDIVWTIDDLFAEGSKVVFRFTVRGTHRGPVLGFPGTGRRGIVSGMAIMTVENGRLVEGWTQWDTLGLLHQLGITDPTEVTARADSTG